MLWWFYEAVLGTSQAWALFLFAHLSWKMPIHSTSNVPVATTQILSLRAAVSVVPWLAAGSTARGQCSGLTAAPAEEAVPPTRLQTMFLLQRTCNRGSLSPCPHAPSPSSPPSPPPPLPRPGGMCMAGLPGKRKLDPPSPAVWLLFQMPYLKSITSVVAWDWQA